jgi:hypothetical protein
MWLYPWLTCLTIVAIVASVVSMAFVNDDATRDYLVPSLISAAIVLLVAFGRGRVARLAKRSRSRSPALPRGAA